MKNIPIHFAPKSLGALVLGLSLLVSVGASAASDSIEEGNLPFLRTHKFGDVQISPTGEYLAATVPLDGGLESLAIFDRKSMTLKNHVTFPKGTGVYAFEWVNCCWIVYSIDEQYGDREQPSLTGELYTFHIDEGVDMDKDPLIGWRNFKTNREDARLATATVFDSLPSEDMEILVAVAPWSGSDSTIERIQIDTGKRTVLWRIPVGDANCESNPAKSILICSGSDDDKNVMENSRTVLARRGQKDWQVLNDQSATKKTMIPIGFKNDNQVYVGIDQSPGHYEIHLLDIDTGETKLVSRDPLVDPLSVLRSPTTGEPYAVVYESGKPRVEYLAPDNEFALLHKKLQASFPDGQVRLGEATSDLSYATFVVRSDRIPGDFYLYDNKRKSAQFMVSEAPWLDAEKMSPVEPVRITARDNSVLTGFLTRPRNSNGKAVPLIVHPHGGPYGVTDHWDYDEEVQLLAAHGFAVLQVNFRGSGGRGHEFEAMGYRNWGMTMQDDITDATRWAIAEGIADPKKICIYGASYGGYAALMGVAKEPDLYRCAVGYVGVYDLPMLFKKGYAFWNRTGKRVLEEQVGSKDQLSAVSPVNLADRIVVPTMLAAGNLDTRAPPLQTKRMCAALKAKGKKPECLYYDDEGHGFWGDFARKDFYRHLVAFFQASLMPETRH